MDGQVYKVNADMAACVIAAEMKVRKLVFLSDVPGVLRDPKDESSLISTIPIGEIQHMAEEGVISGGMIPKLNSAADAIRAGVGKVHMIDGRLRHSLLLEIFTDHGTGTQIVP
jgi:acetylglutamate kinase